MQYPSSLKRTHLLHVSTAFEGKAETDRHYSDK